jgi:mono/diheme cytochrome c family protein
MSRRNSKIVARRWLALGFGVLVAAVTNGYGTGSVNDLCLGKGPNPDAAGRSRSPYRILGGGPQEPRRNPEAQKLKNPEPKNDETVEAGKKLYQRHCASCHGPNGKGDGGMALSGGTPSDLTDETWDYGSTDGEIFTVIRDGVSSDMLAYKDKLNDKQIWQIVHYLRSIGPKKSD